MLEQMGGERKKTKTKQKKESLIRGYSK